MRVPVTGYSLDIGKAHTDFAEAKLQQRLVERKLSDEEINQLAVVAMAGATAEAMNYDQACAQPSCADQCMVETLQPQCFRRIKCLTVFLHNVPSMLCG